MLLLLLGRWLLLGHWLLLEDEPRLLGLLMLLRLVWDEHSAFRGAWFLTAWDTEVAAKTVVAGMLAKTKGQSRTNKDSKPVVLNLYGSFRWFLHNSDEFQDLAKQHAEVAWGYSSEVGAEVRTKLLELSLISLGLTLLHVLVTRHATPQAQNACVNLSSPPFIFGKYTFLNFCVPLLNLSL